MWSEAKGLCGKVRERGATSVRVAFPSAAGSICYYYHSRSAWAVIIVTTESARRLLSNYLKHHKDGRNAGTTLPFSVRGEMKAMSSVGCRDFNLKTRPNCWAKSQGGGGLRTRVTILFYASTAGSSSTVLNYINKFYF